MSTYSSTTSSCLLTPPVSPPSSPVETQFPYVVGATFLAKRHEPPSRSEMGYCELQGIPEVTYDVPQRDWCLAHPPAPGITHEEDVRSIEIAKAIRVGENCSAQLVLTADGFVAKVYDPLYYTWHDPENPWNLDVAAYADRDYITEAAAYSELCDTKFPGDITPTYHGSWTISIPTGSNGIESFRDVRLVIMENIHGVSMQNLDPTTLTGRERENIMARLIEADIDLRFSGVVHEDLMPRNVMLSLLDSSQKYLDGGFRLCMIDFEACEFPKDENGTGPAPRFHNPLFYWIGQQWWIDWGWLPKEEEAYEWMWNMWGNGGNEGKYVVVHRDPESSFWQPIWPRRVQV
ncbi:hypothetical protein BDU57DRAFT_513989 [Ampelomyces quisqualis]|uniref:Protein kinase domain-containing protein n=1 Tax=Ampelomyces quisqualis TaxID=50730 RepID=A0A6A5QSP6_AMPQU|nr:hypothetical protein BDU57DRAFT_513989 [Ampelomyces quisqualis]